MELSPGQIIGNDYRIVQPLAAGGMGAVYVAEQLSTGKRRALKVMHRELASDADSQRRFLQEARVGSLIASEHIVEVQNAGIDASTGHPFLVMELLEGEDLQTRLARGPLSFEDTRVIVGQLCHALGAAHDANVVHRDLKPQNIFLSIRRSTGATLHVKVLDFGIAKVVESRNATAATGTPLWLAPEQTERGQISCAADVWALGLVVFTMLTGSTFWRTPSRSGGTLVDLLGEILHAPIPAASARAAEIGRAVPPTFDAWFMRCLSRSPSGRFPNAREAHAALVPVLDVLAPGSPPIMTAPFGPAVSPMSGTAGANPFAATAMPAHAPPAMAHPHAAPPPPPRSRTGLFVGIGLALLLVVGAAGIAIAFSDRFVTALSPAPPEAKNTPTSPTSTSTTSATAQSQPQPQQENDGSGLHVMALSDVPDLQAAVVSDATLTPSVEKCVAPVRTSKKASLALSFRVSSAGLAYSMTSGQPLGPHVQCLIDVILKRPLPASAKKNGFLQVIVTWS